MRVATFNIRNVRALDWHSLWFRRRRHLVKVMAGLDVDVWALQEAYGLQLRWLEKKLWRSEQWAVEAPGRNPRGGGESAAVSWRTDQPSLVRTVTRWYGPTPEVAGSRLPGAGAPRIATLVELVTETGEAIVVVNTHLDDQSAERRHESVIQLVEWIVDFAGDRPVVVMGDFNCPLDSGELEPLAGPGLSSVFTPADGPTTNEFGRGEGKQLDHIFVSDHWQLDAKGIDTQAGFASDHFPVFADLHLRSDL